MDLHFGFRWYEVICSLRTDAPGESFYVCFREKRGTCFSLECCIVLYRGPFHVCLRKGVCARAWLTCQHCFHEMQKLNFPNMQEQDSPVIPLKNMKDLFSLSALADVFYAEKCPQLECMPYFIAVVKWTLKLWFLALESTSSSITPSVVQFP